MLSSLVQYWWALALRGVLALVFGILAFIWPDATLEVLVVLFGVYVIAEGVLNGFYAMRSREAFEGWWLLLLQGAVSIVAGVAGFVWPALTPRNLLYLIGFWAIITGVLAIVAAWRLHLVIAPSLWMGLGGIASILFGGMVIAFPGRGALALSEVVAVYAILFGFLLSVLSWQLREKSLMRTA